MVVFFAMFLAGYIVITPDTSVVEQTLLCLFSPVSFTKGISVIATFEMNQMPLTFSTANTLVDNFRFSTSMWTLVVDTILYTLIGWYLDQILPKEFGVPLPAWFCCIKAYWTGGNVPSGFCGSSGASIEGDSGTEEDSPTLEVGASLVVYCFRFSNGANSKRCTLSHKRLAHTLFWIFVGQDVPAALKQQEEQDRSVSLRGLRKVFSTLDGEKVAVNHLDVDMYEGQIFALLGHNGM